MRIAPRPRSVANSALSQNHRECKPEPKQDRNKRGLRAAGIGQSAKLPAQIDRHRARPKSRWRNPEALLPERKSERRARSKAPRKVFVRVVASIPLPVRVKSNFPAPAQCTTETRFPVVARA